MTHNIAIDLGTSGVRMAIRGRGIVYRQSAAIARRGDEMVEIGNDALRMLSRTPATVKVTFPVSDGVVVDESALEMWLRHLIRHAQAGGAIHRPRLLLSVAPDIQPAPLMHLVAVALESGAAACSIVRSDVAAAIGAPIDISARRGVLVCQLGAGLMSATAIAGGRIAKSRSISGGMADVDMAIIRRLRREHGVIIGQKAAESLKIALATAGPTAAPCAPIAVIDAQTGFPKHFEVQGDALKNVGAQAIERFVELIHQVLADVPEELGADLADGGLILTGGGAQLFGLAPRLADEFALACHLVDDPAGATIRGLDIIMGAKDEYDELVVPHTDVMRRSVG